MTLNSWRYNEEGNRFSIEFFKNGARYFGFVNKDGMKDLTNQFGYIHTATLFKGGLLGAGVVLAAGAIGKHLKNKKLVESKKKKGESS